MPVRVLIPVFAAAAAIGRPTPQRTILVVDDEPDVVYMVRVILESAGYDVVTASHGGEALERLDEHPVDLILTDLKMPFMSGAELVEALGERPSHPPVVVMTAYGTAEDVPAKGFMMKPFTREELVAQIQRSLPVEE